MVEEKQRNFRVVGIGGTLRPRSASLGALRRVLGAAEKAGADTELLDLRALDLPVYRPGVELEEFGPAAGRLVGAMRGADALVFGTAAYHGTLAGVTKNALDFAQFLSEDGRPYLDGKVVGLVATAGGAQAAANANDAMVHIVHALRGVVAPLTVPVPRAWAVADNEGNIPDGNYGDRLDGLGLLVVDLGGKLTADDKVHAKADAGVAA